jgi:hypothetical protein
VNFPPIEKKKFRWSRSTTRYRPPETEKQEKALLSRLLVSLCVVVSLSALSASAAAPFPAREMNTGAKHLQIVSGMRRDAYWCGTFLWDVCLQTPTLAATLLLLTAGGIAGAGEQNENDDHSSRFLALVVALALFVVSATPLVYVIGSLVKFASPAAAVASTLALFVFFGVAQLIAAVTLGGLAGAGAAGPAATNAWRACRFIFLWLPHYCVGRVVFDASGGFGDASAWASDAGVETFSSSQLDEKNESRSSFRIPATSTEALIAMGTGAVVYASLALLLERAEEKRNASSSSFSFGRRPKRVWTELVSRLRVAATAARDDVVRLGSDRRPRARRSEPCAATFVWGVRAKRIVAPRSRAVRERLREFLRDRYRRVVAFRKRRARRPRACAKSSAGSRRFPTSLFLSSRGIFVTKKKRSGVSPWTTSRSTSHEASPSRCSA